MSVRCCSDVEDRRDAPSPFTRLIALDYWDGPVAGLIDCAACGRTYLFRPLFDREHDTRWARPGAVRIYSFTPVDRVTVLSMAGVEKVPGEFEVWTPRPKPGWSEENAEAFAEALHRVGPPVLAVASDDLTKRIRAARRPSPWPTDAVDWYGELNV